MGLPDLDEFALIRKLTGEGSAQAGKSSSDVIVGVGDDAAVARITSGFELVMCCDTMVESIHFKPETMKHFDVGFKAMAANLSDIAAMGAIPKYALVALSTPRHVPVADLEELYRGLYACANPYDVAIVGGDTTSTAAGLTISVTVIGEIEAGQALLRSSAQPGDIVFVTGQELGCSAAGLHYLLEHRLSTSITENIPDFVHLLVKAHQRPIPQLEAGRLLRASGRCGALNDISDGLASEAWEIAEASGVGLMLQEDQLPLHESLVKYASQAGKDSLEFVLYGGEDYQLIGTARSDGWDSLCRMFADAGIAITAIGEVVGTQAGVTLQRRSGEVQVVGKRGYNHFT